MNIGRALKFAIVSAAAVLWCNPAMSNTYPEGLKLNQLFRVKVGGTNLAEDSINPIKDGTAFAISTNTFITAGHTVGRPFEFKNMGLEGSFIYKPDRKISVETARTLIKSDGTRNLLKLKATESPIVSVDAARLKYTDGGWKADPFKLNACGVNPEQEYFAYKFSRSADGGTDIYNPLKVRLKLRVDVKSPYGDGSTVVVMSKTHNEDQVVRSGDSGSPVLNGKNEVVGIITNATAEMNAIHVTLVDAFLDLIPRHIGKTEDDQIPCSGRHLTTKIDALVTQIGSLEQKLGTVGRKFEPDLSRIATLEQADIDLESRLDQLEGLAISAIGTLADVNDIISREEMTKDEKIEMIEAKMITSKLTSSRPLIPGFESIFSEMARPKWNLSLNGTDDFLGGNLTYVRSLSLAPYSERVFYCFFPMYPVSSKVEIAKIDDPHNSIFYEHIDNLLMKNYDLADCQRGSFTSEQENGVTNSRTGSYRLTLSTQMIRLHDKFYEKWEKRDEKNAWGGRYYLVVVTEHTKKSGTPAGSVRKLEFKAILDVSSDNKDLDVGGIECVAFDLEKFEIATSDTDSDSLDLSSLANYAIGNSGKMELSQPCKPHK